MGDFKIIEIICFTSLLHKSLKDPSTPIFAASPGNSVSSGTTTATILACNKKVYTFG